MTSVVTHGKQSQENNPVATTGTRLPTDKTLATVAIGIVVLMAAVSITLWWPATRGLTGDRLVTARFEALKIGLTIGVAAGGAFALYLAYRRQRSTEADVANRDRALRHQQDVAADNKAHQERVAAATEEDAVQRRIADLYTRAVEQLGSEKAPVRLGGLYSLERLAQRNKSLRKTVIDIMAAYLRMPYPAPDLQSIRGVSGGRKYTDEWLTQEREIRIAVQRIISAHLSFGTADEPKFSKTMWRNIELDLRNAVLIDFDLSYCAAAKVSFDGAHFVGEASFQAMRIGDEASFTGATFDDRADFIDCVFEDHAYFEFAEFRGESVFCGTQFNRHVYFKSTIFQQEASFESTGFDGAFFHQATFNGPIIFTPETIEGNLIFDSAKFLESTRFSISHTVKKARSEASCNERYASFHNAHFYHGVPSEVRSFKNSTRDDEVRNQQIFSSPLRRLKSRIRTWRHRWPS